MTMMNRMTQSRMNQRRAMPQHRRGGRLVSGSSALEARASPLRRPDRPKNTGHELRGLSGVSTDGLGNMCRMSEIEPELRRRPSGVDGQLFFLLFIRSGLIASCPS